MIGDKCGEILRPLYVIFAICLITEFLTISKSDKDEISPII